MRDPELLLRQLKAMRKSPWGEILPSGAGAVPSNEYPSRVVKHHIDLLIEVKHAKTLDSGSVAITNAGYDFLEALERDPSLWEQFLSNLEKGKPLVTATSNIINLASRIN